MKVDGQRVVVPSPYRMSCCHVVQMSMMSMIVCILSIQSQARDLITRFDCRLVGRSIGWSQIVFFGIYGKLLHYCAYPNAWLAYFITTPAHPTHPYPTLGLGPVILVGRLGVWSMVSWFVSRWSVVGPLVG